MKEFNLHYKDLKLIILDKLTDQEYIKEKRDIIFNILLNAYKHIDGCDIYRNPKHMYQSVGRYKIVIDTNNIIYAVAVYRKINESYKCILIGGNNELNKQDVKESVQFIIKSDITNFKKLYQIEASGPIKHWEEKYGAIKIPNTYVKEILPQYDIEFVDGDDYSYIRKIQTKYADYVDIEKTMFGFSNPDILNKILTTDKSINDYVDAIKKMYTEPLYNSLQESVKNNKAKELAYKCQNILGFINEVYNECGAFHNMKIDTYKFIKKIVDLSVKIYKEYPQYRNILDNGDIIIVIYILKTANIIKLHELK